jgi:hypothetical protein
MIVMDDLILMVLTDGIRRAERERERERERVACFI